MFYVIGGLFLGIFITTVIYAKAYDKGYDDGFETAAELFTAIPSVQETEDFDARS